ncbi:MAG: peptidoglycan-binding protein, partial [Stackebrandtia sp.]
MNDQPTGMKVPRTRRWVLSRAAATAAAVAVPSAWAASAAADESSAFAAVDMEMILVAAMVDPPKPDTGT